MSGQGTDHVSFKIVHIVFTVSRINVEVFLLFILSQINKQYIKLIIDIFIFYYNKKKNRDKAEYRIMWKNNKWRSALNAQCLQISRKVGN